MTRRAMRHRRLTRPRHSLSNDKVAPTDRLRFPNMPARASWLNQRHGSAVCAAVETRRMLAEPRTTTKTPSSAIAQVQRRRRGDMAEGGASFHGPRCSVSTRARGGCKKNQAESQLLGLWAAKGQRGDIGRAGRACGYEPSLERQLGANGAQLRSRKKAAVRRCSRDNRLPAYAVVLTLAMATALWPLRTPSPHAARLFF